MGKAAMYNHRAFADHLSSCDSTYIFTACRPKLRLPPSLPYTQNITSMPLSRVSFPFHSSAQDVSKKGAPTIAAKPWMGPVV